MSRKSDNSSNSQNSQEDNDSFLSRGIHMLIPDWQRGRSQKQANSDSDIDTLGVVLPDHIEPASQAPKSSPLSNKAPKKGLKQQSQWWTGQSKPGRDPEQSSSLNSNGSELDGSSLTWGRHYKLLLATSGLLFIIALGLGLKSHTDNQTLRFQKQSLEQTNFELSSALSALHNSSGATAKRALNVVAPSSDLLNALPNLQQSWGAWSKTQAQLESKLDANVLYRKHASNVADVLKSGWSAARLIWGRAGQAGQWNNQVQLAQSIDGLMVWSSLASEVANGKSLAPEASSLEKNITQSLQATSTLNNDPSLVGQTWKSVAQTWIAARPTILDMIAQSSLQNEVSAEEDILQTQSNALKDALNNALQQIDDASSSVASKEVLAFAVFILSIVALTLALFLQGRQARFYATSARHELSRQAHGLEQMGEVLREVKSGHWQTRLPVKTGVVGEVSHEINNVLDSTHQMVLGRTKDLKDLSQRLENIQTQTGELTDKSNQLMNVLTQSGSTLLTLEEKTEQLEKHSMSVNQVLSQSKSMGQNGEDAVQGIGKNMGDLQSRIQEISRSVENLTDTSKQVDGCIENLSHLAARAEVLSIQTDLRAVQSAEGEPFRLVAKEMHDLAEENEVWVKRIAGLTESLIREAQVALEGVQKATQSTESAARLVDLTEDAWRQLSNHSHRIIEVVEKMRESSINQSQVVNELSEHTQDGLTLLQDINKQSGTTHGLSHETLTVCQTSLSDLNQKT